MRGRKIVWLLMDKAESLDEIHNRYKVNKQYYKVLKKSAEMRWFACQLSRQPRYNCQFRVRWNQQSGHVWESGVHNHGPEAYKEVRPKRIREWLYLEKALSCFSIRCKYLVSVVTTGDNNTWFQCRKKLQLKCPYIMRWNSETGDLFESDRHNHAKPHDPTIKLKNEWQLLNGKSAISLEEIRRQYSLKKIGSTRDYWCARCEGKKCYFRLRWKPKDGAMLMLWNKKKLCPRAKDGNESMDLEENGIEEEVQLEEQSLQQQNEDDVPETTPPTPELLIVEQQNREDHKCHLPHMKLEATGSSATAAGRQLNIKREITIGEEEEEKQAETQQQPTPKHVHPHCKRTVKKEEPTNAAEEPTIVVVVEKEVANGRREAVQAPTKMLLRERKRPPNYAGLDGNNGKVKKALRRGGAKK